MTAIQELARGQFGQDVTRKRPQQSYNSSGQLDLNYGSTTDVSINIVLVKNYQQNTQEFEGIKQTFPAKIFGATDIDIKDYDLIETATEIFQVVNAQIKANNITGSVGSDTAYFYADLTYFDPDTTIE
jgi:hypothetical protein